MIRTCDKSLGTQVWFYDHHSCTLTVPFVAWHYLSHKTKDNVVCQQSEIMSVGNRACIVYKPITEVCAVNMSGYSQMLSW